MSPFEILLVLGMTAVTFGARWPVLALMSRMEMPPALERALRYIPASVLAAIIAPALFMPEGELALRVDNAALVAGAVAIVVAARTRKLLLTILVGMAVFWGWRALMGLL